MFMGDGELRSEMEAYIRDHQLSNVLLTGFVNQAQIPMYYAAADVFAMCSDTGETWGLSTNEAMNLALPLLLSDQVGCATDLLEDGANGLSYPMGDVAALAQNLQKLLTDNAFRKKAGRRSLEIVRQYSYDEVIRNLLSIA